MTDHARSAVGRGGLVTAARQASAGVAIGARVSARRTSAGAVIGTRRASAGAAIGARMTARQESTGAAIGARA